MELSEDEDQPAEVEVEEEVEEEEGRNILEPQVILHLWEGKVENEKGPFCGLIKFSEQPKHFLSKSFQENKQFLCLQVVWEGW